MKRHIRNQGGINLLLTTGILAAILLSISGWLYSGVNISNASERNAIIQNNFYYPVINSITPNSVNIAGTIGDNAYQYVYILRNKGAVVIDSDQTPSGALPLFDPLLTNPTFSSANITTGDIILNSFYGGSTIASTRLAVVSFSVFQTCFVDVITLQPICYENGDFCNYPFEVDPSGPIIYNNMEAEAYLQNAVGDRGRMSNMGCYFMLRESFFGCCASDSFNQTNIPVQIIDRRLIFLYSTAVNPVEFCTIEHAVVPVDCSVTFPIIFTGDFIIDYGDGSRERHTGSISPISHTYSGGASPLVNVTIYGNMRCWSCFAFRQTSPGVSSALIDVLQWGDTDLRQVNFYSELAFRTLTAGPPPSTVEDLSYFFRLTSSSVPTIDKPWNNNVNLWDISNVFSLASTFQNAALGTSLDVSNWDLSRVSNTCKMFNSWTTPTTGFSTWNTTTVLLSSLGMFDGYMGGSIDIDQIPTPELKIADGMFVNVEVPVSVTPWTTPLIRSVNNMFLGYNNTAPNIGNWNISNVFFCDNFIGTLGGKGPIFTPVEYDSILIKFATEARVALVCSWSLLVQGKYSPAAAIARQTLINRTWTINDLGPV